MDKIKLSSKNNLGDLSRQIQYIWCKLLPLFCIRNAAKWYLCARSTEHAHLIEIRAVPYSQCRTVSAVQSVPNSAVSVSSAVMSYQPEPEKSAGNSSCVSPILRLQGICSFCERSITYRLIFVIVAASVVSLASQPYFFYFG